jgi:hypothetical protein
VLAVVSLLDRYDALPCRNGHAEGSHGGDMYDGRDESVSRCIGTINLPTWKQTETRQTTRYHDHARTKCKHSMKA